MIIGTPKQMDIKELMQCPNTRGDLFNFYKGNGAERTQFDKVVARVEKGETVYYSKQWFAFYDQEGNLLAGENPDWGD
ncbi:hypothetical protein [Paenibacillus luteus]|uniref:hypothetical protein n=1 Tax=Paenibacillus luteus TaxID=2545753 RepID=UPI001142CBBE|nr:hypothetical protein [Paenibacillus luteus]